MARFFLSMFFIIHYIAVTQSQSYKATDSIAINSAIVSIDALNNIYGLDLNEEALFRISPNGKKITYRLQSFDMNISTIDTKDPFKVNFVMPAESKIITMDQQFQILSEETLPFYDPLFSLSYSSNGSRIQFAQNHLSIYDVNYQLIRQSEALRIDDDNSQINASTLYTDYTFIYLHLKNYGVIVYNNFLNVESTIKNRDMHCITLFNHKIYYSNANKIYRYEPIEASDTLVYEHHRDIKHFTLNNTNLIVSDGINLLKLSNQN